ncbi:hypothetical protein [Corynebacterium striatum]|nr:hypothetical protein U2A4042170035 [Corynebacterium striatum]
MTALTHAQKMELGWAAINNERGDDGALRLEGDRTRIKNNLVKKGIARLVEGVWVDYWGKEYRTKDWYVNAEHEELCTGLIDYYRAHEAPELGAAALSPEEWEVWAG